MKLLLDILQGAGLAAAAGLRPFLPALVAGGLASADLGIDFDGTSFAFLESPWWLLAVTIGLVASFVLRRFLEGGAGEAALAGIGLGMGALLFAGTLDDRWDTWWPGIPAGLACGALAAAAARTLLGRVRRRLDQEAAAALPIYVEGAALLLAALSVLLPPLGLVGLVGLALLLVRSRRREGEKYAGLRILR